MQRDTAIPLYYQLETILKKKILAGDISPGAVLPSETALADKHGVSRVTVRQALSLLEQQNLIVRRRGKGTYVADKVPSIESAKFSGFMQDLITMGIKTKARILSQGMIEPPDRLRGCLKLGESEQVLRIEKVRLVEGSPLSYIINYLPPDIGHKVQAYDLTSKPLLTVLEENLGVRAVEAIQTVEATVADAEVAPLLDVTLGDPLLKVERTVLDADQRPVEHVSVLYRADKYHFLVRIKRGESAGPGGWESLPVDGAMGGSKSTSGPRGRRRQ